MLALFVSASLHATETCNSVSLAVENSYMEQILAEQNVANSQFANKDFLIASFMSENQKRFKSAELMGIRQKLTNLSEQQLMMLSSINFKDPTVAVVLSVFLGGMGIDRFYIGDIGAGVGKLLTLGGFGIWWLVDLFAISGKTKKNNSKDFNEAMVINSAL